MYVFLKKTIPNQTQVSILTGELTEKSLRCRFLESVSRALDSYLPRMSGLELLKSAYCLCLMGHFPPALLERLLQRSAAERPSSGGPVRRCSALGFSQTDGPEAFWQFTYLSATLSEYLTGVANSKC